MVRKVCLDSAVIIGILNGDETTKTMVSAIDAQFLTTAISSFEIWQGNTDKNLMIELLEWLNILELDDPSARCAADLFNVLKQKGEILELRDIFIAAICIKNDIELLTLNKKHFERLKKYGLRLVEPMLVLKTACHARVQIRKKRSENKNY